MKIIVEHGDTKRQIEGAFNICASARDFSIILSKLTEFVDSGSSYGWVQISDVQKCISGTKPDPWEDTAVEIGE